MRHRRTIPALALLLAAGCVPPGPEAPPPDAPALMAAEIESDAEGRCFGRDITPAQVETVTAQELETPAVIAPDGTILSPAVYRSVIRQRITRERREIRFETICPPAFTADFVASMQRALSARGFYTGPIDGALTRATGRAVQDFQRSFGIDSPLLSIIAARRLGLVALSAEQLDQL